jgi:hypothetical protein
MPYVLEICLATPATLALEAPYINLRLPRSKSKCEHVDITGLKRANSPAPTDCHQNPQQKPRK